VVSPDSRLSRRDLLVASGAAGAGAALAGCAGVTTATNPTLSKTKLRAARSDVPILNELLQVEYLSAYAYTAAVPLLSGHSLRLAHRFLHQELAHITILDSLIAAAHGQRSPQRPSYPIGRPGATRDLLAMLHGVESKAIAAYLGAVPKLSQGVVRAIASAILANEGQHIAVLRGRLGLVAVPDALASARE
jgi:hypothetical protein